MIFITAYNYHEPIVIHLKVWKIISEKVHRIMYIRLQKDVVTSIDENLKDFAEKVQYFTKNYKIQEVSDRETKHPMYMISKN